MSPQIPLLAPDLAALRGLMATLDDAVLLLDEQLRVLDANPRALATLQISPGQVLPPLRTGSGARLPDWLRQASLALREGRRGPVAPSLKLDNGQRLQFSLVALDESTASSDPARWLLLGRIQGHERRADAAAPRRAPAAGEADALAAPLRGEPVPPQPGLPALLAELPGAAESREALLAALAPLWDAPLPLALLDGQGALQLANPALRELQLPHSGRPLAQALQGRWAREPAAAGASAELMLKDGAGRERLLQCSLRPLVAGWNLALMQDRSAELAAREHAERLQAEVEQWLALSPLPLLMFDAQGLVLRANAALAQLLGGQPATLHEVDATLQTLLGWTRQGPDAGLAEPGQVLVREASLPDAQGRLDGLRATVCRMRDDGRRRYLAVLQQRGAELARELAAQQIDALMDLAGVALATRHQSLGWLRPDGAERRGASAPSAHAAALQGVNRDMVEPDSRADYERLQQALKKGEAADLRYAVQHPELGRRWLRTRVAPGRLSDGQRLLTVLTQDMSAQQQALSRGDQLLQELSTIMDSAGLGLAYFRDGRLLRSNGGFGRMLGLDEDPPPGSEAATLFAPLPELGERVAEALAQLDAHGLELEFQTPGQARWHALALRRVDPLPAPDARPRELIAVISDISRLKAQQAQLQALAQDRELMFSLSDVGIAILRADRIERANEALAALLGYRIDELSGLPLTALFDSAAQYQHEQRLVRQALGEHGLWRGERRVRRRDGSVLWMQVSKRLLRPGEPDAGLIATYVNVDDRHRAQQSLMLQTERERAVLDSVLVGIVTVGRAGIEWMNRSARRMFGGDLVEFAGQPMSMVATPDPDHPFRQTHYLEELTEGQAETFECRLKARDGREFWVVGNAVVTGGGSGRQLTYALLDIERRRLAEAQSLQAQASLRRIIEAAPLAISLHDARTLRVEQINQVAAALAGRSESELLGASPEDLFGAEQGRLLRADMEAALQGDGATQREYRLGRGEPQRLWDARLLHLSGVAEGGGASEDDQVLLVASDVTEQRAQEAARLEAAIAQRELLVREVHHRIKNNLQGVAGLLQQIANRRPEVKSVINEAVGQVQAIAQVYGLQVGASGPLRLRKVVEAITGSVQRMFGREIRCEVEGPLADAQPGWSLPEAESIPIALTLNELLTNAVKHSPQTPVHCVLRCEAEHVLVEISNEGQLPAGFDLAHVPGGVSGLGLVRALLPRRSALLTLEQRGARVGCSVMLMPPSISLQKI
ncbi:PAS domain S-box protein [Pelomonas sp. CA6]|uniref:PAS domain S-box protein n=1 Tax=Pelomonas sp. CA6 TaxID=2907999 RepID=UPI001F4C2614|nr:PAS domain S-box protein [Pelomonas sp. CA6]MCH7343992.1 PAS domain S-box protein [Pelomonas sp. CA6]